MKGLPTKGSTNKRVIQMKGLPTKGSTGERVYQLNSPPNNFPLKNFRYVTTIAKKKKKISPF